MKYIALLAALLLLSGCAMNIDKTGLAVAFGNSEVVVPASDASNCDPCSAKTVTGGELSQGFAGVLAAIANGVMSFFGAGPQPDINVIIDGKLVATTGPVE